jgi:hypothetical protein
MIYKSVAVILNGCIRDLSGKDNEQVTDFSGYIRCIEHINELLKDFQHVDIFFHTWNPFQETNVSVLHFDYDKEKLVSELHQVKNVRKIIFENQYTAEELDSLNATYTQFVQKNMQYKQNRTSTYSCFRAFKTLCNDVLQSERKYDYILRSRNDLLVDFENFQEILNYADKNYLCMPPNCWCFAESDYTNDHWLFGLTTNVFAALSYSTFDDFKEVVKNSWNQEHVTNKHMKRALCSFYTAPVKSYVILHLNRKLI